jgi:pSer/pThr/pTyr-binding forkhead associated (FHA) protein
MHIRLDSVDLWSPVIHRTLDRFPIVLGRHPQADIRLSDRWADDLHCRLDWESDNLVVRDLQSQLGTLVNGDAVQCKILFPGDLLTVGIRVLRIAGRLAATEFDAARGDRRKSPRAVSRTALLERNS